MLDTRTIIKVLICWICFSESVLAKDNIELGNRAFGKGDYTKAIEYYHIAIDNRPTVAAYVNLGHCYMQLKRWDEAVSAYEAAIRTKQDDITPEIWRSLGRAHFERYRYEQAIDAFIKASLFASVSSQDDIWIARCMIQLEQWIQAETFLLGQLRKEPGNTDTLELLGYVFNQQNNWSGIIGIYRELLNIAPHRTAYRITLAKALTVQGQKQQAIDLLEFTRRVDAGSDEEINRLLADLYLAEEMPQEAAGCYARLVRIMDSPSSEDYYRLGLAYFQTGDLTSAKNAFSHMQQLEPTDFKADLYLGHVAVEAGLLDDAKAYYRDAVEKNPTSVEGLVALADLQMKSKYHANAAKNLAKAIELGDNRPLVHYNYILALMNGKDKTIIKEAIKEAIAEHPSDEQLKRLLDLYIKQAISELSDG